MFLALLACNSAAGPKASHALRWGGDAEGGAPFVEADPANPALVRGFDVEIASFIANGLKREPRFVQVAWASIGQSVERGDFAVGMSGIEDTPEMRTRYAPTIPYFEFREVLAVRTADSARYPTLASLRGHRVGSLGSTQAFGLLTADAAQGGVMPVSYDDDVHPYGDLIAGRLDAVLLDHVIAERSRQRTPGFVIQPVAVARGHYIAILARRDSVLRDSINDILRARMRDGSMEKVFRTWNVWDSAQAGYLTADSAGTNVSPSNAGGAAEHALAAYLPALLRAAVITLALSLMAMLLAVVLGAAIAAGRVYGGPISQAALAVYVEVVRGTPVLLQLFVIYYGLSSVVRLPAFVAAVLGLGLNYAAYESEIYRSALLAIPRAQLEAARTLGLSEYQIFRLVRGPQALRLALAPMTNDFVALLKDSSLVSVITVVELTKQTAIYATNIGSWVMPGLLCGGIYLMMSLPLSHVARRLERKWSAA